MDQKLISFSTCIFFFLTCSKPVNAQYKDDGGNKLEFSAGLKTVLGDITYAKTFYYSDATEGFALQPSLRADLHLVLFTIRDFDFAINLVGQTGILQYFKAKKFDYTGVEPVTGDTVHYKSKKPTYLPLYLGFYSPYSFFIGFEAFYYKGIKAEDLFGFKLLSMGYNFRKFRVSAAWELYGRVRNRTYPTSENFFSFDFLWKLKRNQEY